MILLNKVILEYYADKEMNHRIPINEVGQPIFDWGEAVAGEKKEQRFYIKNTTLDTITLRQPYSSDEDFRIKDYPTQLKANASALIILEFAPSWSRTRPLKSDWGFDLIIG